jgi:preprotein translocase subunit YajC
VFISNAYAQAAEPAGGGLIGLLPLILMFVILWFLMIRPQMKRAKEHKNMVNALAKGDEVITQGGVAGRINEIDDNFVHLEIAEKVAVIVQRQSVTTVLPKGTLKTL